MRRTFALVVLLAFAVATPARAEGIWLPGDARAIPRTTSASRDAPVMELAYGPRAQASIGAEPAIVELRSDATSLRLGLYALAGLENATSKRLFPPGELWRGLVGVTAAWELRGLAESWLGPGSDIELTFVVAHESDHATSSSSSTLSPPGPRAMPFGGGGNFLGLDVAFRYPLGKSSWLSLRVQDHLYLNELPGLVGAHVLSDTTADGLHEALSQAAAADVVVRLGLGEPLALQLAVFGEQLFAHDPFVDDGYFLRSMAGLVVRGRSGEIEPFASFDAGNGKGLLVQERALRFSMGVRYAPF